MGGQTTIPLSKLGGGFTPTPWFVDAHGYLAYNKNFAKTTSHMARNGTSSYAIKFQQNIVFPLTFC